MFKFLLATVLIVAYAVANEIQVNNGFDADISDWTRQPDTKNVSFWFITQFPMKTATGYLMVEDFQLKDINKSLKRVGDVMINITSSSSTWLNGTLSAAP